MKIGIFGGCFNPPHKMHKNIAKQLLESRQLDKVIYVPTGNRYEKKNLISAASRYQMLKEMTRQEKNIEVSDYELGTRKYTYQTLRYFQEKYPNDTIYFICGTDNLKELETWRNYEEILTNYKLLIIQRGHESVEQLKNKYPKYQQNIIATTIENDSISSTKIRGMLEKNEPLENLEEFLDHSVIEYIQRHQLYKEEK